MNKELLTTWGESVLRAVSNSFSSFVSFIPNIVGALIVFVVGWILARIVKRVILRVLDVIQLEPFAEKVGISNALKRAGASITPNEFLGKIVRWAIVLVFLNQTAETL